MNPRTRDEFIAAYNKLNNSKKDVLYYRIFANRGFGSSLNLAVRAILHSFYICNRLQLTDDIWDTFLEPIYEEVQPFQMIKPPIEYHAVEHLHQLCRAELANHHFKIPELGIDDDFIGAFKKVLNVVYVLNDKTARWVRKRNSALNIPPDYAGIHIRRGDKVNVGEMEQILTSKYISELQKVAPQIKNVVIATDDYTAFEEFRRECPADWQVVTACDPRNRGRDSKIILHKEYEFVKMDTLNTIADIELLRGADVFIGTYSSNLSQVVGMLRDEKRCYSLDFQEIIPNRNRASKYIK